MSDNKDIAILAKKVSELASLSPDDLEARKWEALLILNAIYSSATPDGIAKMNAEKETRWGDAIRKEGILSALHPKWHLRSDDGKPPVVKLALESAWDNPNRDLRTRLQALLLMPPADRGPLTDLVRALVSEAFNGAKGDARNEYGDVMQGISQWWTKEPWLTVLPNGDKPPPVLILIDNQGATHDGGIYDDPADDTEWEKIKFAWAGAIRTWDINFLRDNVLAQSYLWVNDVTNEAIETAGEIAEGANEAAKGIATILKWAPYVIAGIGAIGATALVLAAAKKIPQPSPAEA